MVKKFSIVTRYWAGERDRSMEICLASLRAQTFQDFQHVVLSMPKEPVGIKRANEALALARDQVKGQYVLFVDDDDYLYSKLALEQLASTIDGFHGGWREQPPDLVISRALYRQGGDQQKILPPDSEWTRKPVVAKVGGQCCIASRRVFRECIHKYGEDYDPSHYGGSRDYSYIMACWHASKLIAWHDKIVVAQQRLGGGRTDKQNGVGLE